MIISRIFWEPLAGNRYEYPSGTDASDSMHLSMTVLDVRSKLVQSKQENRPLEMPHVRANFPG